MAERGVQKLTAGALQPVRFVKRRMSSYVQQIQRRRVRLDQTAILEAIGNFDEFRSKSLFVHSSLSACGHVEGGAPTVVHALRDWIGGASLVMPTHTYCYPDERGQTPVFDLRSTPSVVGAITDFFWRQPGVARSNHPTHSLAANGDRAAELCQAHDLSNTPCGQGTPYERLVNQDCAVLMFGATMNTYTLFHTAEDAARLPFLYEPNPYQLKVTNRDGSVKPVVMLRQNMQITRRFADTSPWLEAKGLLFRQKLGRGELLLIPHAAELHRAVVSELHKNPFFLVAESARAELARRLGLR